MCLPQVVGAIVIVTTSTVLGDIENGTTKVGIQDLWSPGSHLIYSFPSIHIHKFTQDSLETVDMFSADVNVFCYSEMRGHKHRI